MTMIEFLRFALPLFGLFLGYLGYRCYQHAEDHPAAPWIVLWPAGAIFIIAGFTL